MEHLPKDAPLCSFAEFDEWVDGIWEAFYNEHEERAKEGDGILLNKFYNEGSCATVAAAWKTNDEECRWIAYGDSVVFHYNRHTELLLFSSLGHPNFKIGWPYRSNHKVYVVPHPFQVSSPRPAWIEHECS